MAMNGQRMSTPAFGIIRAVVSGRVKSPGCSDRGVLGEVEIAAQCREGRDHLTHVG